MIKNSVLNKNKYLRRKTYEFIINNCILVGLKKNRVYVYYKSYIRKKFIENAHKNIAIFPTKLIYSLNSNLSWSLFNYSSIIKNLLLGISNFFFKIVELKGLGFKVQVNTNLGLLIFKLGFSHEIKVNLPEHVEIKILNKEFSKFKLISSDKQLLGYITQKIKSLHPVEPYKGRGVIITGQYIFRKESKKLT